MNYTKTQNIISLNYFTNQISEVALQSSFGTQEIEYKCSPQTFCNQRNRVADKWKIESIKYFLETIKSARLTMIWTLTPYSTFMLLYNVLARVVFMKYKDFVCFRIYGIIKCFKISYEIMVIPTFCQTRG